ncbi:nucleotide exchange factor GrpE [Candidatus Dependentiae bacterium]|nr:nucleotide exchange factor GrpE [Candidatus Dependentiae bacterium]
MIKDKKIKIKDDENPKFNEKQNLPEKNIKSEDLEKLQREHEKIKDQLLRVNSDFQNFKRRIEKEKTEWIDVGQTKVIKTLLPFIDDLDLAMQNIKKEEFDEKTMSLLEGFLIIQKKLKKALKDLEIKQISTNGQFDPSLHEALMQVDSKEHESGQIVQVFSPGYLFKDKVLRHAKVSVAK